MPLGPITQGFDFNFFKKVTIINATFNSQADVVFNIKYLSSFTLMDETSSTVVEYSFNGTTLHGEMDSSKDSKTLLFDNRRVTGIWFRMKSGASAVIRVEAWAGI